MPMSSRGTNGAMCRLWFDAITLTALAVAAAMALSPRARAQNLVSNPNFTDGLSGYQATGNVGVYQLSGVGFLGVALGPGESSPSLPGPVLTPSNMIATLAQTITTTPGAFYTISFSSLSDHNVEDIGSVTFGNTSMFIDNLPTTGNGNGGNVPTAADLRSFSFVALATSSTTLLHFEVDQGGFGITGLDVAPGPAPITGGVRSRLKIRSLDQYIF